MTAEHASASLASGVIVTVFIMASVLKLQHRTSFLSSFDPISFVPQAFRASIANAIILMELATVFAVLVFPPFGFATAFFLLVAFQTVLLYTVSTQSEYQCACFGRKESVDFWSFTRNFILMGFAVLGLLQTQNGIELQPAPFIFGVVLAAVVVHGRALGALFNERRKAV